MNKEISPELAYLLQDKGINIHPESEYRYTDFNGILILRKNTSEIFPYAPTVDEVKWWFYEKRGIWIYSYPVQPFVTDDEDYPKIVWVVKCLSMGQIMFEKFIDADNGLAVNHHASPIEAHEAAFKYILNSI